MRDLREKPASPEDGARLQSREPWDSGPPLFERANGHRRNGSDGEERVPVGLSVQWPLIRIGQSFRNMARAYRNFFTVSSGDLKDIYRRRASRAAEIADHQRRMLYMEKVVALDPDDSDAIYALGLAYERNDEPDRAYRCYREVIRLDQAHAKAHFRLGLLLMRRRDYEAAIQSFQRAIELEPESAELHFRLGQAHDRRHEHDRAIECFNRAVEIDDEYLPAYKHMALTYDSLDNHRKALDCLKRALELEEASA